MGKEELVKRQRGTLDRIAYLPPLVDFVNFLLESLIFLLSETSHDCKQ